MLSQTIELKSLYTCKYKRVTDELKAKLGIHTTGFKGKCGVTSCKVVKARAGQMTEGLHRVDI